MSSAPTPAEQRQVAEGQSDLIEQNCKDMSRWCGTESRMLYEFIATSNAAVN